MISAAYWQDPRRSWPINFSGSLMQLPVSSQTPGSMIEISPAPGGTNYTSWTSFSERIPFHIAVSKRIGCSVGLHVLELCVLATQSNQDVISGRHSVISWLFRRWNIVNLWCSLLCRVSAQRLEWTTYWLSEKFGALLRHFKQPVSSSSSSSSHGQLGPLRRPIMTSQYGLSSEVGGSRPVSWRSWSVQPARGRPGRRLQSRPSERPDDRATWQWTASCTGAPSEPSYVAEYWQTASSDEVHDRWQAGERWYLCVGDMKNSALTCLLVTNYDAAAH